MDNLLGIGSAEIGTYARQVLIREIEAGNRDIPNDIREALAQRTLVIQPFGAFSTKRTGAGTQATQNVVVFDKSGDKKPGFTNLKNRKIEKGELFLVIGVQVEAAEAAGATDEDVCEAVFRGVERTAAHAPIANGEIKMTLGKKIVFDELPVSKAKTVNNQVLPEGFFEIDTPKFVKDSDDIEFEFQIPGNNTLTVNSVLRVTLWGAKLAK
jgi:hypothetical protein